MKKFTNKLRTQIEENPMAAIAVTAVAITAIAKLTNAHTEHMNSKTWAKEVDRRRMNQK